MQISIDGTVKAVFEKIRRKGHRETVDASIRRVVARARELARHGYEWNVHLAYVVMRSNLQDVAHAVEYAADLDVAIRFNPVKGFHLLEENIFVYRNLLDDVPDWRASLKAARMALESRKATYSHYEGVRASIVEIQRYLEAGKIRVPVRVAKVLEAAVGPKDAGHLLGAFFGWSVEGIPLAQTPSYIGEQVRRRLTKRLCRLGRRRVRRASPTETRVRE